MRKGQGKIEVFAVREDILRLLRAGFDICAVHADLLASGQITVKRRQFHNLVQKHVQPLLKDERRHVRPELAMAGRVNHAVQTQPPQSQPSTSAPVLRRLDWDPSRKIDY